MSVEFRLENRSEEAVDDVRSAVQGIRTDLPADLRDPVVRKLNITGKPILAFTVSSSKMDESELSGLLTIPFPGVFRACRAWGRLPVLVASIVRYRLSWIRSNWRPQVSQQRRFHASYVMFKWRRLAVMPSLDMESNRFVFARVKNINDLSALELPPPGGKHFRPDNVATIKDTIAERRALASLDGQKVVGFEVTRAKGAGEVEVGDNIARALRQIKAEWPDLQITQSMILSSRFRKSLMHPCI